MRAHYNTKRGIVLNQKDKPEEVRNIYMRFRVNEKEKEKILELAAKSKYKNSSEYIREKALKK